jgi:hypothetical protein
MSAAHSAQEAEPSNPARCEERDAEAACQKKRRRRKPRPKPTNEPAQARTRIAPLSRRVRQQAEGALTRASALQVTTDGLGNANSVSARAPASAADAAAEERTVAEHGIPGGEGCSVHTELPCEGGRSRRPAEPRSWWKLVGVAVGSAANFVAVASRYLAPAQPSGAPAGGGADAAGSDGSVSGGGGFECDDCWSVPLTAWNTNDVLCWVPQLQVDAADRSKLAAIFARQVHVCRLSPAGAQACAGHRVPMCVCVPAFGRAQFVMGRRLMVSRSPSSRPRCSGT